MTWYGADPGGKQHFGVAALEENGTFRTCCYSSVKEAMTFINDPAGVGIDCPLWWSSVAGGGRKADRWLRDTYNNKIHPGTVQAVNSLRGAIVVQGVLLAMLLRERNSSVRITETHPKALLQALELTPWGEIAECFELKGPEPDNDHEHHKRDALLGAVAAREGFSKRWTKDLSACRDDGELDPKRLFGGSVHYWWPKDGETCLPSKAKRALARP